MNKISIKIILLLLILPNIIFSAQINARAADKKDDQFIKYLTSREKPYIFKEHKLKNGKGGFVDAALCRSFYDPLCNPPVPYTKIRKGGEQFAIDAVRVDTGRDEIVYVISDSDNKPYGPADGFEDGLGNSAFMYDQAMTIFCLIDAGMTDYAQKIINTYAGKVFIMFDGYQYEEKHPRDQGEWLAPVAHNMIALSFDKFQDNGQIPKELDSYDSRAPGYPLLSPGYEFGYTVYGNMAAIDDKADFPRVTEFNDYLDSDDIEHLKELGIDPATLPHPEEGFFYGAFWPYGMFCNVYDIDKVIDEGADIPKSTTRLWPDQLVGYSKYFMNYEYVYREWGSYSGDNLWLCLSILFYTYKTGDTSYLPTAYKVLDTIVDNLQDFNGGIHFGYYGPLETTPEATEHSLDWMFCWNWIEKLKAKGLIDNDHYKTYKEVTYGNLNINPPDIKILNVVDLPDDDKAVKGARWMLQFMGIPYSIINIRAGDVNPPILGTKVLILPNTPVSKLKCVTKLQEFMDKGGCVFGTCRAALYNSLFGVKFLGVQEVGPIQNFGRNIVITKIYKDGIDNPSEMMDVNENYMPDLSEAQKEPDEIDNWEELDGRLTFAFEAAPPYENILVWSSPDYKRSRLVYYLHDQGTGEVRGPISELNSGHTPNISAKEERTNNSGNPISTNHYTIIPILYGANEDGKISLLQASVDLDGIENWDYLTYKYEPVGDFLYFKKHGKNNEGKSIYFRGDIFDFFYNVMTQQEVKGIKYSPYISTYIPNMKAHSQILENALTWFFTKDLEPYYTVHKPYSITPLENIKTYKDDKTAGNLSAYLWRSKNLKHLGVKNFLEHSVWGNADYGVRLPPGYIETGRDDDGDGAADDLYYEKPWLCDARTWGSPDTWERGKMFIRGQFDFVKALDTIASWAAIYFIEEGDISLARDMMKEAERLMRVTVTDGNKEISAYEYWDLPNNAFDDDFGDAIWLEGTGQMAYCYKLLGDYEKSIELIKAIYDTSYEFPTGARGVPYSWPKNNVIDTRGPDVIDDVVREDALCLAATTWAYLAKNEVEIFAKAHFPRKTLDKKRKALLDKLQFSTQSESVFSNQNEQ